MQACPVQLQAGLNRGLLKRYYVKKNWTLKYKTQEEPTTNYNLHLR